MLNKQNKNPSVDSASIEHVLLTVNVTWGNTGKLQYAYDTNECYYNDNYVNIQPYVPYLQWYRCQVIRV